MLKRVSSPLNFLGIFAKYKLLIKTVVVSLGLGSLTVRYLCSSFLAISYVCG